jgi:hypothetical protein
MRRTTLAVITTLFGATATLGIATPAVAAATTFGNGCIASNAAPNFTLIATGSATGSAAAPVSGVITKATFNVPGAAPVLATVVKIMRFTGVSNQYRTVAQSPSLSVPNSVSTHDVRLPVTAGDFLGLYGATGTLYCATPSAGDTVVSFTGDASLGSTQTFTPPTASTSLPVVATIEPDVDGDGYGDITQDLCPQAASVQAACPTIKLDSLASGSGGKINLVVTSSSAAKVSVSGLAKVNGKKIKLKAASKQVDAGSLTQFKVKVPAALRAALAKLPPSKKITVTITVSATNVAGVVSTDTAKVKLPGTK